MKNKKWLIPVGIIGVIVIVFFIGINLMISKGMGISTGLYLEAKNNTSMFIRDESPIQMSNRTDRELIDDLDIGDKILVIHTGIEETYPAKTGVYAIFKIKDGTTGDITQNVINQLIELGWLETNEEK